MPRARRTRPRCPPATPRALRAGAMRAAPPRGSRAARAADCGGLAGKASMSVAFYNVELAVRTLAWRKLDRSIGRETRPNGSLALAPAEASGRGAPGLAALSPISRSRACSYRPRAPNLAGDDRHRVADKRRRRATVRRSDLRHTAQ